MTLAIPVLHAELAPRFRDADRFLVASAEDGAPPRLETPPSREGRTLARWLAGLGVRTVLAREIDIDSLEALRASGLFIIPSVEGDDPAALHSAFRAGTLRCAADLALND